MSKDDHNDLCSFETNLYYGRLTDKEIRKRAYDAVVAIRSSNDVPAFELYVEAEYQKLKSRVKK